MASRSLDDLLPHVKEAAQKWLDLCKENKLEILITCTYRSPEEQATLYAKGRTVPGKKVTNAKPGQSSHQHKVALDFAIIENGKINWNNLALYTKAGNLAKTCGFVWAGDWKSFKESCHIEWPKSE